MRKILFTATALTAIVLGIISALAAKPNVPTQGFTTVTDTMSVLNGAFRSRFTDNILRVGVNYKF